ncbi:SurA N-terminal domain-containing protein [Barrientosiimonas marina]|uniref:peptidylprolyl isomerase n=1 Tax=Lentibacillus kimchii TaxID=1542911 RepID=A0ABW2UWB9_9BACI
MKKLIMLLAALSLAVVLAACGDDDDSADKDKDKDTSDNNQSEQASKDMPKPNLDDVPDVVAKVNGEKIKKDEFSKTYKGQFQQMAMRAKISGKDLDQDKMKKQTAEGMVGNKLLTQEADNRDYNVSDEEVDDTLKELSKQQRKDFESTDDFVKALEDQGMDKDKIMSQVKKQVQLDKLIDEESGDLEPSKKEVKNAYDQYKKQQKQINKQKGDDKEKTDIKSFDEKKPDLKKRVERQNRQKATQSIVKDLRDDADVTVNL